MQNEGLSTLEAYDKSRKEFYKLRHQEDIERRVAKEEAMMVGAYFGKSALEIGMELEDRSFENWRAWAQKEVTAARHMAGSSFSGLENEDSIPSLDEPATQQGMDELEPAMPNSSRGQSALGGAAIHP